MSAVQALAALLSANADAGSRVAASSIAANASNANANAALQGDIYRSNMQGQVAHRGIDADMQRFVGEQALRSMLGRQQMGIEAGRLGLGREQLGLNRQQMNQERDFRLGEIGRGPYAPNAPAAPGAGGDGGGLMGMLQSLLGGGQKQGQGGDIQDHARRMIMANPGDPRVMQMWGPILNQGAEQNRWQAEMDFKQGARKDPLSYLPYLLQNPDFDMSQLGSAIQGLRAGLSGTAAPKNQNPGPIDAHQQLSQMTSTDQNGQPTNPLNAMFGVDDKTSAEEFLQKIIPRNGSSWQTQNAPAINNPQLRQQVQDYIRNRAAVDPSFLTPEQSWFGPNADTVGAILKAFLEGGDVSRASLGTPRGGSSNPRLQMTGY